MPDTTLQANLDPLGIWAATPETGVAFSASEGSETSVPIRRVSLPPSPDDAQTLLAAQARALTLMRQYLDRAAQELALIGPSEQISFATADELAAQKSSLALTIDQLRSPVSYGLKFKTGAEEQETAQGWHDFVEQVRQAVVNYARVRTDLGGAPVGLTTVSWQGDFETTWTLGARPDQMQVHLNTVQVALDSRLEMVRTVSVVATGVFNILSKSAIPGGQLLLLPAVYKFVRDTVQQLRKQK